MDPPRLHTGGRAESRARPRENRSRSTRIRRPPSSSIKACVAVAPRVGVRCPLAASTRSRSTRVVVINCSAAQLACDRRRRFHSTPSVDAPSSSLLSTPSSLTRRISPALSICISDVVWTIRIVPQPRVFAHGNFNACVATTSRVQVPEKSGFDCAPPVTVRAVDNTTAVASFIVPARRPRSM